MKTNEKALCSSDPLTDTKTLLSVTYCTLFYPLDYMCKKCLLAKSDGKVSFQTKQFILEKILRQLG